MYSVYALVFLIFYPAHGYICIPKLSDGTLSLDNFKQIECEVSTCSSFSQLRFEKIISKQWTPVYERVNKTYHQSLDTTLSQHSLRNRSNYKDFLFKHILYINPVKFEDQGKWRCVVYDMTGLKYASKAIDINIYVTPPENIRIVPNNVELYTYQTTEFVCLTDGIYPEPDVLWSVNGTDKYTGTSSNKQHADRLWSVMNTIKLSFNTVGVSDLSCIMRTNARDRWMQNQIRIIVKDTKQGNRDVTTLQYDINGTPPNIHVNILNSPVYQTITYSLLGALGLLLMILAMWQVIKRSKSIARWFCKRGMNTDYGMIPTDAEKGMERTVLDIRFLESPQNAIYTTKIVMEEQICCIWRSTHSDSVFVGGHNSPFITIISSFYKQTSQRLPQGTSIVHGLFINTTTHVINVYDATWNTHSIYCVDIESPSTVGLTINATLELSHGIMEPCCIFAIDKSSIGVYCAQKRLIDVFNITYKTKPSHVDIIKLSGYDADKNDSLCMNPNDHICVLSYKYCSVYIYNKRGEYMYNFNTGMWYDHVHIQCFSDNSLTVINLYGEIHRFDEGHKSEIINLGENNYAQAAMFTQSKVWIIDALDSTKIHVFGTGLSQELV